MKKRSILKQFVVYPNPLRVLPNAAIQVRIQENLIQITGLPQNRKLTYLAGRDYGEDDLWYLLHIRKRSLHCLGMDKYNEMKTDEPLLLIGHTEHLKKAAIIQYESFLGLNPRYRITYRLGAWKGRINIGSEDFDNIYGERKELQVIVSAGMLARDTPFEVTVDDKSLRRCS